MGLLDTFLMSFYERGSLRMSTDRFSRVWWRNDVWYPLKKNKKTPHETWHTKMKECKQTHSLTHKTSTYEPCKLLFLLQCATAVVWNKRMWSKTLQLRLALGTHRTHVTVCTERRSWSPISPIFSSSPLSCHLNIFLAKEKSTVSATRVVSENLLSVFLLHMLC